MNRCPLQDFALVADQTFCLKAGLNVISGESGSGKSVLLAAFSQVLGMQTGDEFIREPATTAGESTKQSDAKPFHEQPFL